MPFTAAEIAGRLQGEVAGDPSTVLNNFAPADRAQPGDLTFAENADFFERAHQSAASAIIVDGPHTSAGKVLIRVPNARIAFAKVLALFFPEPVMPPGVHALAVVAASARIDPSAHIGPHCVVGERAIIGPRSVLQGGNHVGADCRLGEDVILFPNVTVYPRAVIGNRVRIHAGAVIGSDGFGYVQDGGVHRKVPQIGNVIIGDDVEIGANTTIDRGALGPTVIGKGSKIDNLVQIAHNVALGDHCIIISRAGRPGRHGGASHHWQPGDRCGAGGRDAQHSGRRKVARFPGTTRQAGQAAVDRHPAPAQSASPGQRAGEKSGS
jgi:UDP-3-O-[3-hydroxymyristoyl] glucosamine N-acyltransferase